MEIYVLDSSAILSGKPIDLDGRIVIPESVEREVMKEDPKLFDFIQGKEVSMEHPSKESLLLVKEAAEKLGEGRRLSRVDKEVLAVALDNLERGDVCIITDDYSIQNVASFLGLKFKGLSEKGISERFVWRFRCKGCKKVFKRFFPSCPICGSELKPIVKRKTKVRS